MARFAPGGATLENLVERRQDEEREQRRTDQAADDDGGERFLNFAAGAGGEKHRDQAERGDARGDEHRTQPQHGALDDGEIDSDSFAAQFVEVADHDDAVEHGDAEERDEADARADAQIEVADDEREDAADQREGNVEDDEHRLFDRVERAEEQQENRGDGDRHDDGRNASWRAADSRIGRPR